MPVAELPSRLPDAWSAATRHPFLTERVYLEAWTAALPGAPAYRDFVAHWTTPQFVAYVAGLERAADVLGAAGEPSAEAVGLAGDVLTAERVFWDMATEGT